MNKKLFQMSSLSTIPGIIVALLPQAFCPACWPAYAGVLSSLGLNFVDYTPWLLPAVIFFLAVSLFSLYYNAAQRRGYTPFLFGLLAACGLVLGRFYFEYDLAVYFGGLIIVLASIWNAWPISRENACVTCEE